ncbi:CAMK/CAMK1 protein kinase [Thecamonas trahens ATCC 50062]|uniref:CAMK/CAMK1 protein kinase n=1 Tax=Thecamonas trahens ATCC 50062 TaxID=461836 RepID=A0A0L0D2H8_THETB|nr:CAMK/CAMK1 protein kinase [Thecamonas trahens ATCC 50062]KNC46360.1 CAMK/CAMK1 protein kinase [Thecamonas trahens ATCC 50062]|eukprot:XP_013760653.1 CAMK/CAMK1 protein kinase [Thecamonas trahens ATCC 50062]
MAAFGAHLIKDAQHVPVGEVYTLGKQLGAGSFSKVYHGVHNISGDEVAVKIIDKDAVGEKTHMLLTEVEIMQSIDHPNVITLLEIFETPSQLVLVMELVSGGELFERIVQKGNLSEAEAAGIVRQILQALKYLHSRNVVHRDLKPENLLFAKPGAGGVVKIADFGLSTVCDDGSWLQTACGTPGYVAPEILKSSGYSTPVDLWSVGVILYILLCGFPPFYDENLSVLFDQIMSGQFDYPSPYWDHVSDEAKDLIEALLTVNPKTRLTAAEALDHEWLAVDAPHTTSTGSQEAIIRYKQEFKKAILARLAVHKFASSLALLAQEAP